MSRWGHLMTLLLAVLLMSACGATRCEKPDRYAGSNELPPVQVPDDLTPPDESRSLRIPQVSEEERRAVSRRGPCLESPPDYFEGGRPE